MHFVQLLVDLLVVLVVLDELHHEGAIRQREELCVDLRMRIVGREVSAWLSSEWCVVCGRALSLFL